MIDIGIAGPLGAMLAWLTAALLLLAMGASTRVGWSVARRGLCRASVRIGSMMLVLTAGLAAGVAHFATTAQTVEVAPDGGWTAYSAYGLSLWQIPADEARQVRVLSPLDRPRTQLQVRRADGSEVVLYGYELRSRLGYRLRTCGAWEERPMWGPHQYAAGGPQCADEPWPAALDRSQALPLASN